MDDEPDGEQQGQHNGSEADIQNEKQPENDAENARNQRGNGAEARPLLELDVEDNVRDADDDGNRYVDGDGAAEARHGIAEDVDAEDDEENTHNKLHQAKC